MDGLNSRREMTENRISKLEDGTIEITHAEQQRENKLEEKKKWDEPQETVGLYPKNLVFMTLKFRSRERDPAAHIP